MSSEQPERPGTADGTRKSLEVGLSACECRRSVPLVVGLALVGAILTWAVLKVFYPPIVFPENHGFKVSMLPPPEMVEWARAIRQRMALVNPVFALGFFGAILSGAMSLAWLGRWRTRAAGLLGAVLTAAVGGGFGCLAGLVGYAIGGVPASADSTTELAKTLTLQVAVLMVFGAGVGIGIGSVMIHTWRATGRGLGAGVAGGFLAGLLHTPLAALLFPAIRSDTVVPSSPERTLWIAIVSLLLGITVSALVQAKQTVAE